MKKFFFLFACILYSCISRAQLAIAPEIGISSCSMKVIPPSPYNLISNSSIAGGKIGGIADIGLSEHLYFQSGLFFTTRGSTKSFGYNISDSVQNIDQKIQVNYLELPINVLFKTGTQGIGRIFFGLGASVAYTLGGSNMIHNYGHAGSLPAFDTSTNTAIQGGRDVTKLDVGLNFIAGYEFRWGLFLRVYYYTGFTDISTFLDESDKNRAFGFSAGYFLGKSRHTNLANELIAN